MQCDEFLYIIQNYLPQDLEQVERIWIIDHIKECESCCQFVSKMVFKEPDLEAKRLAELDKKVIQ